VFPLLIAVAVDDHLAIRFPVALLDHGRSFAILIAVIRAYRHSGSNRTNSDTNTDFFRARRYCRAYIANTYFMNRSWRCAAPTGSIRCISFRSDRIDQRTPLRQAARNVTPV
jgi:hypothetical protein